MKRFIIILTLVMTSVVCNAQIRYLGTTNNRQSTQTQQYQESQVQTYSTTAYYQSGNGYVKLPIRVKVQDGRIIGHISLEDICAPCSGYRGRISGV